MSLARAKPVFTAEDYLAWEEQSPDKHQYLAGEIFAMSGATDAHVTITMNLAFLLRTHLRGRPCRVYAMDMKLRVETADAFFYPDLLATCVPDDIAAPQFKRQPTLVVEVLSASTAASARRRSLRLIRRAPSREGVEMSVDDGISIK